MQLLVDWAGLVHKAIGRERSWGCGLWHLHVVSACGLGVSRLGIGFQERSSQDWEFRKTRAEA